MSELINGDLLSSLKVYYAHVGGYDSLACGNLLLCKKIKEWELQERLVKLHRGDIFTTGPRKKMRIDIILLRRSRGFILFRKWKPPRLKFFTPCLWVVNAVSPKSRRSILQNRHNASQSLGGPCVLSPGLRKGMGFFGPSLAIFVCLDMYASKILLPGSSLVSL